MEPVEVPNPAIEVSIGYAAAVGTALASEVAHLVTVVGCLFSIALTHFL
jgi:hypothetical protein